MLMPVLAFIPGCAIVVAGGAEQTCAEQAKSFGEEFTVAASFATSVGYIRSLTPAVDPVRWPDLEADAPATVCYLDGPLGKAPPYGEPYDRALVGVAGGASELIKAGYQDRMAIDPPD